MVRLAITVLLASASFAFGQAFGFKDTPWLGMLQASSCTIAVDDFESYANGAVVNALNGGTCWNGAYNDQTTPLGLQASDDFESYTDAYNVAGLSGGSGSWYLVTAYNFTSGLFLEAYDTLEGYSDSASLNGLGGGNWNGSTYSGRGFFSGPTDIGGMAYYWNYSDLTPSANVSAWIDRVQAKDFHQGNSAKQPTNSASGVYFSGTTMLTNAVTLPQSKFSIWIGYKMPATQAGYGGLVTDSGGTAGFFMHSLSFEFYPLTDLYIQAANIYYDTVYVNAGTGTTGGGVGYTNGIATPTITDKGTAWTFNYFGSDNGGESYKGFIKFICIWTNTSLSATDAANLSTYGSSN